MVMRPFGRFFTARIVVSTRAASPPDVMPLSSNVCAHSGRWSGKISWLLKPTPSQKARQATTPFS